MTEKNCTFPLTPPEPALHTDTQTFPLKAKRPETTEDWLFSRVMEALILLRAPPEKCVCRPQELLTFGWSAPLIHRGCVGGANGGSGAPV